MPLVDLHTSIKSRLNFSCRIIYINLTYVNKCIEVCNIKNKYKKKLFAHSICSNVPNSNPITGKDPIMNQYTRIIVVKILPPAFSHLINFILQATFKNKKSSSSAVPKRFPCRPRVKHAASSLTRIAPSPKSSTPIVSRPTNPRLPPLNDGKKSKSQPIHRQADSTYLPGQHRPQVAGSAQRRATHALLPGADLYIGIRYNYTQPPTHWARRALARGGGDEDIDQHPAATSATLVRGTPWRRASRACAGACDACKLAQAPRAFSAPGALFRPTRSGLGAPARRTFTFELFPALPERELARA